MAEGGHCWFCITGRQHGGYKASEEGGRVYGLREGY